MEEDDLEPAGSTFGKVLRQLRREKELTQAQLAQEVGTSQQNIQGIEAGKSSPGPEIYENMLNFFGHNSLLATVPPKQPMIRQDYFRRSREVMKDLGIDPDDPHSADDNAIRRLREASTSPNLRDFNAAYPLPTSSELSRTLLRVLPEELRMGVDTKLRTQWSDVPYRVDYLGSKVCMEIKIPSSPTNVLSAARSGMQQLYLFGAHLRYHYAAMGERPPELVLALFTPNFDPMHKGDRVASRGEIILREALVMGVRVFFPKTVANIAQAIIDRESGRHIISMHTGVEDGEELETDE